jgi:hypothetical protein
VSSHCIEFLSGPKLRLLARGGWARRARKNHVSKAEFQGLTLGQNGVTILSTVDKRLYAASNVFLNGLTVG